MPPRPTADVIEAPGCKCDDSSDNSSTMPAVKKTRVDRSTKKRSTALQQLIEIIDKFQDRLLELGSVK